VSSLTDFQEVPVVDVSGLYGDEDARRAVAEELARVSREVGFLYVTGHGVDERVYAELLTAAEAFFALPLEEKQKVYIGNSTNHRGYVRTTLSPTRMNVDFRAVKTITTPNQPATTLRSFTVEAGRPGLQTP